MKNTKIIFFHEKIKKNNAIFDIKYLKNNNKFIVEKTVQKTVRKNTILSTENFIFDNPEDGYREFTKIINFINSKN